jgi:small subunit ribosomal protein S1
MGLRGFLPGSHLCGVLPTEDIVGTVRRPRARTHSWFRSSKIVVFASLLTQICFMLCVQQTLKLKFLEVNQETNKLVVSNRRAVVENSMTEVKRGDVVTGIVKVLNIHALLL